MGPSEALADRCRNDLGSRKLHLAHLVDREARLVLSVPPQSLPITVRSLCMRRARLFIYMSDFPALDEPLPRFLDDPTAAKFMAALAQDPNLRRRLMVELWARTGMRVGELGLRVRVALVRTKPWCRG